MGPFKFDSFSESQEFLTVYQFTFDGFLSRPYISSESTTTNTVTSPCSQSQQPAHVHPTDAFQFFSFLKGLFRAVMRQHFFLLYFQQWFPQSLLWYSLICTHDGNCRFFFNLLFWDTVVSGSQWLTFSISLVMWLPYNLSNFKLKYLVLVSHLLEVTELLQWLHWSLHF